MYMTNKEKMEIRERGKEMNIFSKSAADFAKRSSWMTDKERIEKVIFNPPATIIFWKNGDKTIVKVRPDEVYDPEKGLAMAIAKYAFGNKADYYNAFRTYLPVGFDADMINFKAAFSKMMRYMKERK